MQKKALHDKFIVIMKDHKDEINSIIESIVLVCKNILHKQQNNNSIELPQGKILRRRFQKTA